MRAHITFRGPNGGQHSIRRPLRILHLADGTYTGEISLDDIPVRATWAQFELEPDETDIPTGLTLVDSMGNPIPPEMHGY